MRHSALERDNERPGDATPSANCPRNDQRGTRRRACHGRQITVEGDDDLLSYAVNKAAGDPENRITFQQGAGGGGGWYEQPLGNSGTVFNQHSQWAHYGTINKDVGAAIKLSFLSDSPLRLRMLLRAVVKWILFFAIAAGVFRLSPDLFGLLPRIAVSPPLGGSKEPPSTPPPPTVPANTGTARVAR
jgi:hypothetical protein